QSDEYFNRAGRNFSTFINQAWTDLFGHSPLGNQGQVWLNRANSGENIRQSLPFSLLFDVPGEYYQNTISQWYLSWLRRLPSTPADSSRLIPAGTPYGAQMWVNSWAAGANPADIQVALVSSAEYMELARTKAFWTGARWLS